MHPAPVTSSDTEDGPRRPPASEGRVWRLSGGLLKAANPAFRYPNYSVIEGIVTLSTFPSSYAKLISAYSCRTHQ